MIIDYTVTPPVRAFVETYHPPHLRNYDNVYQSSDSHEESSEFFVRPIEEFLAFLDRAGISKAVIKARDIGTTFGLRIPNEAVAEIVSAHPTRFIGMASADPYMGAASLREFERAVTGLGLRGLNLQLYELKMLANDRRLYPLYAKCVELDVPVNIHTSVNFSSQTSLKYGHPLALDDVALEFPDLKIIASPPGWPWVHELIAVAWRHANVFIGISTIRPKLMMKSGSGYEPLFAYGNGILQDKIIYGSGWPLLPMRRALDEVRSLPWREGCLEKFLHGNATSVFRIGRDNDD